MPPLCPDRRAAVIDGRTNAARGAKASARRRSGCCAASAVQVDADRQLLRTDQQQQSATMSRALLNFAVTIRG